MRYVLAKFDSKVMRLDTIMRMQAHSILGSQKCINFHMLSRVETLANFKLQPKNFYRITTTRGILCLIVACDSRRNEASSFHGKEDRHWVSAGSCGRYACYGSWSFTAACTATMPQSLWIIPSSGTSVRHRAGRLVLRP